MRRQISRNYLLNGGSIDMLCALRIPMEEILLKEIIKMESLLLSLLL